MKLERNTLFHGTQYSVRVHMERLNERVPVIGNYSEVMMHFGLAGKPVEVALVLSDNYASVMPEPLDQGRPMCQVYVDGKPFSAPILPGEGGFYYGGNGPLIGRSNYYTYADASRLTPEMLAQLGDQA